MPGLPFPNHDAANNGCQFSYPRSADQTCCQQSRARFSPDEQLTPEESSALYCKPVELYNIIQQKAIKNPPSLQRCLRYKIDAKRKKSHLLLQRREFFHPQKAQRMEPEEVFADHDSEDKIDDDIADFEDRRMLDDFVDVSKDEKRIMHMWNSFVRKQRVLADGHIPWACEAFSRQHGQQLVHNPALLWSW